MRRHRHQEFIRFLNAVERAVPAGKVTLADFRRSGTVEAIRGGAEGGQIAAKMANQFDKSAFLSSADA